MAPDGSYRVSLLPNHYPQDCPALDEETPAVPARTPDQVIDLLEDCKKVHNSTSATKSLVLTTFMKLSHRLSGAELPRITQVSRHARVGLG